MIPTPADVEAAMHTVGADVRCREAAVRLALFEAEHLADDPLDVPAALHFAFTRHPATFSRASGRVLAVLLARVEAQLGLKILATPSELEAHLEGSTTLEATRDWFASRVVLFGG